MYIVIVGYLSTNETTAHEFSSLRSALVFGCAIYDRYHTITVYDCFGNLVLDFNTVE